MSRIIIITTILAILSFFILATAFGETTLKDSSYVLSDKLFKAIGVAGLGFAAGAGAIGIGLLSKSFIEGIYRNPETTNKMLVWYFIAFALIEAQVLYTLFFVFQLFFAK